MPTVRASALPAGALLERYGKNGAYTDCFSVTLPRAVSLAAFIEAFYTTPLFKTERLLLAAVGMPSTDAGARELAQGQRTQFAAWKVEAREAEQILLDAGRTRSWLMVEPSSQTLYFGSAVVPGRGGKALSGIYGALLGFHQLYSRLLLGAAARRLSTS